MTTPPLIECSSIDEIRARAEVPVFNQLSGPKEYYRVQQLLRDRADLLSHYDELAKRLAPETEADGPTCLWEPIEEGIRCYNTCRPGEEFNLDDGCDPYPFCHWCGRRIVIPECPWCGGEHVGTDCRAEKANAQKAKLGDSFPEKADV